MQEELTSPVGQLSAPGSREAEGRGQRPGKDSGEVPSFSVQCHHTPLCAPGGVRQDVEASRQSIGASGPGEGTMGPRPYSRPV